MSTPFEETYQEEHQAMQLYDFVAEGTPIEEPTVQSILASKQPRAKARGFFSAACLVSLILDVRFDA